jgi:hypothetical protein
MWLSKYQYFPKVFVLPPWKAIYVNDAERDHTTDALGLPPKTPGQWSTRQSGTTTSHDASGRSPAPIPVHATSPTDQCSEVVLPHSKKEDLRQLRIDQSA